MYTVPSLHRRTAGSSTIFEITGGGESVCLFEDGCEKRRTFSGGPDDTAFYLSVDEPGGHYEGAGMGGEYRGISFPGSFLQKNPEKRHSCRSGHAGRIRHGRSFLGGDLAGIRSRLAYIGTLASWRHLLKSDSVVVPTIGMTRSTTTAWNRISARRKN